MGQYYYLAASLPMLWFDEKPSLQGSDFVDDCLRLMSPADASQVRQAYLNVPHPAISGNRILQQYRQAEFGLRNELVKLRAKKMNAELDRYLRQEWEDATLAAGAREVFEQETPLKAEQTYCRVLWQILDDLSVGHQFDVEFLILYYLKLQILERMTAFNIEAGKQTLDTILTGEAQNG